MSDEDRFMNRLREDAVALRFEPDLVSIHRMTARIRARITQPVSVSSVLARWFRPVAASLAALSVTAALTLIWAERSPEPISLEQASSSGPVMISMDGDTYSVGN